MGMVLSAVSQADWVHGEGILRRSGEMKDECYCA